MLIFIFISGFIMLVYGTMMVLFRVGWSRAVKLRAGATPLKTRLSVIIAVRNEENNLPGLLIALANQSIPRKLIQVIFIDDQSEDKTLQLLKDFAIGNNEWFEVHQLPSDQAGKKAALRMGLGMASGDLLVTTDGDCLPGEHWLKSLANCYEKYEPDMILGPVSFVSKRNLFNRFLQVEMLSLIASAAGSAGIGHPILCNGANLAYRKKIPGQWDDPFSEGTTSGDDMLMMEKFKQKGKKRILSLVSNESMVVTNTPESISDFFHQRFRWVSKGTHYRDRDIIAASLLVLITNTMMFSLILLGLININYIILFLIYILIKSIFDLILLIPAGIYFNHMGIWRYILPFQLMYIPYVVISTIGGLFGSYRWKSRTIRG